MGIWSILGLGFTIFILIKFIYELGRSLPILELLLLIAGLQWIVGPLNSYSTSAQHFKYYMYVNEATYMSYVVPAFLVFAMIILFHRQTISEIAINSVTNYSSYGKPILLIGFIADLLFTFAPPSLLFFLFLLSQFKYVGAGILLFSSSRKERYLFYAAIAYLIISSLRNAMFHGLVLWGAFLFMLWASKNKPNFQKKTVLLSCAAIALVAIQMVKATYREQVWTGYSGNKVALFIDTFNQQLNSTDFSDDSEQEGLNTRLNQGWIISAIMKETPQNEPFADGATVTEALSASLLPRFLAQDKKIAGGQENFRKYTGLDLGDNTSMGLSIMGEAYANFGDLGGIIFMLIWGLFLTIFWNKILAFCKNHPLLVFFIPLLFLQVVKAETELVVVLNHLVKASIVVGLFFCAARKFLNWNI